MSLKTHKHKEIRQFYKMSLRNILPMGHMETMMDHDGTAVLSPPWSSSKLAVPYLKIQVPLTVA